MTIVRDIRNKGRSQRGASLPFALLLFLICALLASVVLAATSGVAGRHSQMAEMDRHYYSATSAANLLWDEIKSQPVTLECVQTSDVSVTVTYGANGSVTRDVPVTSNEQYKLYLHTASGEKEILGSKTLADQNLTFAQLTTLYYLLDAKATSADAQAVWNQVAKLNREGNTGNAIVSAGYTLDHTLASTTINPDDLKAVVQQIIAPDGSFQLTITSGDVPATKYSVLLECDADYDIDTSSEETPEPIGAATTGTRVEVTHVTKTQSVTVDWSLAKLEKAGV